MQRSHARSGHSHHPGPELGGFARAGAPRGTAWGELSWRDAAWGDWGLEVRGSGRVAVNDRNGDFAAGYGAAQFAARSGAPSWWPDRERDKNVKYFREVLQLVKENYVGDAPAGYDDLTRGAARSRYRFYQDRGFPLNTHKVSR